MESSPRKNSSPGSATKTLDQSDSLPDPKTSISEMKGFG